MISNGFLVEAITSLVESFVGDSVVDIVDVLCQKDDFVFIPGFIAVNRFGRLSSERAHTFLGGEGP